MVFRIFLTLFLLVSLPAGAQEAAAVLTVRAEASVPASPDMAFISVGVEVNAATAGGALSLNSTRMAKVLALLKSRGIAAKDIQTSQFSLRPVWNNRPTSYDKPLKINGFQVTNEVQVRLKNLALLGPVLDALIKSGANRIQGVRFGVSNPGPFLDKARIKAVIKATHKARIYARAAGLSLGPVLSISEAGQPRVMGGPTLRALASAVPVAEGEIAMRAEITMRFSLKQP